MKAKILILLSMLLFVVSCGTHPAQKDFDNKMKEIQTGNIHTFDSIGLWGTFTKDISKDSTFSKGMKKITYKINKVQAKGNTAIINVFLKAPDLTSYVGELQNRLSERMSKSMPQTNAELQKQVIQIGKEFFDEKFDSKDLKYSEKTLDVKYIKNGKDWVISDENEEFFKIITFGLSN